MNEINGFTFYRNYYELIDNLDRENKSLMLISIVDYVFKDIEPNLSGMNKAIWTNIVLPIEKSKSNSKRSKNHNQKETKKKPKRNQKETNNISYLYFLISNFILNNNYSNKTKTVLEEWVKYKDEREDVYTEVGFNKLLSQIKNNIVKYGEEKVVEVINSSMASMYKGIIFEKLEKQTNGKTNKTSKPEWFDKKIEDKEASQEEMSEIDALLGKY